MNCTEALAERFGDIEADDSAVVLHDPVNVAETLLRQEQARDLGECSVCGRRSDGGYDLDSSARCPRCTP